jgi:hypothetical protein
MNTYRKIANRNHEEWARLTTRSYSQHGLGAVSKLKKIRNRSAKRLEEREAFRIEEES